jgi:hypothetical protein
MAQRLFHPDNDAIMQSSTVLTTTGTLSTFPVQFLQDQLRQKPVRWGLYVVDEHNDRIDVTRTGPGTYVVQLVHGTYDTPADYIAMVQAAFETADSPPSWTFDYNAAAAFKFRIRDAGGATFALLWQSGANAHRSAGIDLGFDVTANDTGTNSYTADLASYQSRKFLVISKQDGSNISATAAIILEHTATQTGAASVRSKVTIQGNATNAWSAPSFSEDFADLSTVNALDNPNVPCVQYFASGQSLAFYRLVIDDVQHATSYGELGRFLLGTYSSVSICVSNDIQFAPEDFSTGQEGPDGTAYASYRRHRDVISMGWKEAAAADHAVLLQFFQSIPAWRQWFLDFEVATPTELYYGYFKSRPARAFVPYIYWDWTVQFCEAL